jgi:hypothetical protein
MKSKISKVKIREAYALGIFGWIRMPVGTPYS